MDHKEYAQALRNIADWIEAHPEIPVPHTNRIAIVDIHSKSDLARLARAFGDCKKETDSKFFIITKDFGGILVEGFEYREKICERVVVGAKQIPERIIPEQIIPAHDEEIVEWKCPDLLSDSDVPTEREETA